MSNDETMKSPFDGIHSKKNYSDFEHSSFFRHSSLGIRHWGQNPESTWCCRIRQLHDLNQSHFFELVLIESPWAQKNCRRSLPARSYWMSSWSRWRSVNTVWPSARNCLRRELQKLSRGDGRSQPKPRFGSHAFSIHHPNSGWTCSQNSN